MINNDTKTIGDLYSSVYEEGLKKNLASIAAAAALPFSGGGDNKNIDPSLDNTHIDNRPQASQTNSQANIEKTLQDVKVEMKDSLRYFSRVGDPSTVEKTKGSDVDIDLKSMMGKPMILKDLLRKSWIAMGLPTDKTEALLKSSFTDKRFKSVDLSHKFIIYSTEQIYSLSDEEMIIFYMEFLKKSPQPPIHAVVTGISFLINNLCRNLPDTSMEPIRGFVSDFSLKNPTTPQKAIEVLKYLRNNPKLVDQKGIFGDVNYNRTAMKTARGMIEDCIKIMENTSLGFTVEGGDFFIIFIAIIILFYSN